MNSSTTSLRLDNYTESHNLDKLSRTLVATASASCIISILGGLGNLVTILALSKSKKITSTSKFYVIGLALVELLYCFLVLPVNVIHYSYYHSTGGNYFFSEAGCNVFNVVRFTLAQSELQIILAIGVTRAIAITFPRIHQIISRPLVICGHVMLIYLYSLMLRVPVASGSLGKYTYNERAMKCGLGPDKASKIYRGYAMIIETILPISLILLTYIYIFIKLKISTYQVRRASHDTASCRSGYTAEVLDDDVSYSPSDVKRNTERKRKDFELASAIFVIFLILMFCTVPITALHIYQTTSDGNILYPRLFLTFHITYWMHFCLNIFVYVFCNHQYRCAYVDLLKKTFPKSCKSLTRYSFTIPRQGSGISSPPVACNEIEGLSVDQKGPGNGNIIFYQRHDLSVIPEIRTSQINSSAVY